MKFNEHFHRMLDYYEVQVTRTLKRPGLSALVILVGWLSF